MPVCNGEPFIHQALDSLLAQDYTHFELIITDNASTDGTAQICRTYAARDKRIRYYRYETNIGAARNFSRVFELSTGDYFMWAAHDDLWEPAYIARLVSQLNAVPDAVLAFSAFDTVNAHGQSIRSYLDLAALPSAHLFDRLYRYILQMG